MIEYEYKSLIVFFLAIVVMLIASVAIPVYGYKRKRYKGLAIGCVAQVVAVVVLFILIDLGYFTYIEWKNDRKKDAAMVTIRSIESHADRVDTLMWYIKDDGECVLENEGKKEDENSSFSYPISLFDVIRLNTASVCVEDRVMVKFDIKSKKVMATDYDAPAEVVNVDWDKVNAFIEKKE
jgi:Ca2+/H+ antiporter